MIFVRLGENHWLFRPSLAIGRVFTIHTFRIQPSFKGINRLFNSILFLDFNSTLPDYEHSPPTLIKQVLVTQISFNITFEFFSPKISSGLWKFE